MVLWSDQVDCEIVHADHVIHFEHAERQLTERFWCDIRDSLCRFRNSLERSCKIINEKWINVEKW